MGGMMTHKKKQIDHRPQRVFIFWSFVPELWSRLIVNITGRKMPDQSDHFSHMGIAFEFEDYTTEAYEALFDKGFFGPEPLESIVHKVESKGGMIVVRGTGMTDGPAQEVYDRANSWVGTKGYHAWQLAAMWWFERFGRMFGWHVPISPGKHVCSESVARLLAGPTPDKIEWPYIDLRDDVHTRFDEVNPNSAYRKYLSITQGQ